MCKYSQRGARNEPLFMPTFCKLMPVKYLIINQLCKQNIYTN